MRSQQPRIRRRRARHDVVFYTPWVGSILSRSHPAPAGGAETQVLLLAKLLVQRGMRVAIIAFGERSDLPDCVEGVRIVPRPPYRKRSPLIHKALEAAEIWRSLWRAPSRTIVQRGAGIEVGLIALYARAARRRLVFASAALSDFNIRELLLGDNRLMALYDVGVRLASEVVVQTEEQVELCQSSFRRRPALIKSLAPEAERQRSVPEAFVWVGRLVAYKRPLEYLALARALPEARFWMVGIPVPHFDSDREVIDRVLAEAGQIPNLELLPPCPHAEVLALIDRAVACVSTSAFEGMPNVLLEAWARGVPALVLSHDPGGVVGAHGLGGFAGGSPERLVELARAQWERRGEREELASACQRYIREHHAPELVTSQWLGVLEAGARGRVGVELAAPEPTCAA